MWVSEVDDQLSERTGLSMAQRKILIVDIGASFGGVQVYLENLACLLQGKCELLVFCGNPKLQKSLRNSGVRVFRINSLWGKFIQLLVVTAALSYLRLQGRVDTVWINSGPDIVLLRCAHMLGCTAIATRHGTGDIEADEEGHYTLKHFVTRVLYKLFACAADKIICVSAAVAGDLSRIVSADNVIVIPNWVPGLPEVLKCYHDKSESLRLLFVGRLEEYKGAALILDAMRLTGGRQVSLTIVGDGEFRRELERKAEGLNVKFVGFQRDTSDFYRGSDVFINPTRGPEGLPLVSLEAMSYGLPCVLSDLPVHKEITENGKSALLFRCGDAEDLCSKIKGFLSSPELLRMYGELGRNAVESRYSADVARALYVEALEL